jgi:uncharacterized protein (TIGR00255 family)
MHSMTGYGRGQVARGGRTISVEIQSVTKRQVDILINLPSGLESIEPELRAKTDQSLHRGRIVVNVRITGSGSSDQPLLNYEIARNYLQRFQKLKKELKLAGEVTIETILRSPGVITSSQETTYDHPVGEAVMTALDHALRQLLEMRAKEGATLYRDLTKRIKSIRKAVALIRKLRPRAINRYREQLVERIRKLKADVTVEDDRLVREVAFFAERSDFSEELTRLDSHLDLFTETTNKQESIGRTLEFISQEIGRELNTLSAKANDAEISQVAVQCKAELEKIREQIQNVE